MKNINLIDKAFVHKNKAENVLIYNVRRALPRKIEKSLFEEVLLKKVSAEEKKILLKHYSIERFIFLLENNSPNCDYYILHTLPHEVSENFALEFLKLMKVGVKNKYKLLKYFTRDKKNAVFVLRDEILESEELEILRILRMRDWHISGSDKTRLSDILEKFPEIPKSDIFYCNMHVDTRHEFFFEHPNDHVPGIMMIEAVRQFSVACCHIFGKIPLSGMNLILMSILSEFYSYSELNLPITFKCINRSIMKKKLGSWGDVDMDILVLQNNKKKAFFSIKAKNTPKKTFNNIRNNSFTYDSNSRFLPIKHYYNEITIRINNAKKILCELVDISMEGFRIKFSENMEITQEDLASPCEFFLFFQNIGFIHGTCSSIWVNNIDNEQQAGMKITGLENIDRENLQEVIRTMCFIREEREIL